MAWSWGSLGGGPPAGPVAVPGECGGCHRFERRGDGEGTWGKVEIWKAKTEISEALSRRWLNSL